MKTLPVKYWCVVNEGCHYCGRMYSCACPCATIVAQWVRGMYMCPLRGGLLSDTCLYV